MTIDNRPFSLEICVDNLESIDNSVGACRLELCSALGVEGLTPTVSLVNYAVRHSNSSLQAMIRPRSGDFCYSADELQAMADEMVLMAGLKVRGVVFGVLDKHRHIHRSALVELLGVTRSLGLQATFHRAVDIVDDYDAAIRMLVELGFDRVLTSGAAVDVAAGLERLTQVHQRYGNDIQIMAGGGVRPDNVGRLLQAGIDQIHCSAGATVSRCRLPNNDCGFDQSVMDYRVVDREKIAALLNGL